MRAHLLLLLFLLALLHALAFEPHIAVVLMLVDVDAKRGRGARRRDHRTTLVGRQHELLDSATIGITYLLRACRGGGGALHTSGMHAHAPYFVTSCCRRSRYGA
jgi:hypothetical protein